MLEGAGSGSVRPMHLGTILASGNKHQSTQELDLAFISDVPSLHISLFTGDALRQQRVCSPTLSLRLTLTCPSLSAPFLPSPLPCPQVTPSGNSELVASAKSRGVSFLGKPLLKLAPLLEEGEEPVPATGEAGKGAAKQLVVVRPKEPAPSSPVAYGVGAATAAGGPGSDGSLYAVKGVAAVQAEDRSHKSQASGASGKSRHEEEGGSKGRGRSLASAALAAAASASGSAHASASEGSRSGYAPDATLVVEQRSTVAEGSQKEGVEGGMGTAAAVAESTEGGPDLPSAAAAGGGGGAAAAEESRRASVSASQLQVIAVGSPVKADGGQSQVQGLLSAPKQALPALGDDSAGSPRSRPAQPKQAPGSSPGSSPGTPPAAAAAMAASGYSKQGARSPACPASPLGPGPGHNLKAVDEKARLSGKTGTLMYMVGLCGCPICCRERSGPVALASGCLYACFKEQAEAALCTWGG